jgi:hypothetical protein
VWWIVDESDDDLEESDNRLSDLLDDDTDEDPDFNPSNCSPNDSCSGEDNPPAPRGRPRGRPPKENRPSNDSPKMTIILFIVFNGLLVRLMQKKGGK